MCLLAARSAADCKRAALSLALAEQPPAPIPTSLLDGTQSGKRCRRLSNSRGIAGATEAPDSTTYPTATAYSGSADIDAVVTAFVLAAVRASVSAGSIGRTESSTIRCVRACGDSQC
jgi:hypothetical protein